MNYPLRNKNRCTVSAVFLHHYGLHLHAAFLQKNTMREGVHTALGLRTYGHPGALNSCHRKDGVSQKTFVQGVEGGKFHVQSPAPAGTRNALDIFRVYPKPAQQRECGEDAGSAQRAQIVCADPVLDGDVQIFERGQPPKDLQVRQVVQDVQEA